MLPTSTIPCIVFPKPSSGEGGEVDREAKLGAYNELVLVPAHDIEGLPLAEDIDARSCSGEVGSGVRIGVDVDVDEPSGLTRPGRPPDDREAEGGGVTATIVAVEWVCA